MSMRHTLIRIISSALATCVACTVLLSPSSALAAAPAPHWMIMSIPAPTYLRPGDAAFYEVVAVNDGGADSNGEVTVTDALPAGVEVDSTIAVAEGRGGSGSPTVVSCATARSGGVSTVTCRTLAAVPTDQLIAVKIDVTVPASASGVLTSTATVAGGGAQPASYVAQTPVNREGEAVPYGATMRAELTTAAGAVDTQAGSHPYGYTTMLAFNSGHLDTEAKCGPELVQAPGGTRGCARGAGDTRDVEVALPAGLLGNVTAVPQCSQLQFHTGGYQNCPADTQVGILDLSFYMNTRELVPVYSIEPPPGQPGELGFTVSAIGHIPMFFHVRRIATEGGYALSADLSEITQFLPVRALVMTIWGEPSQAAHTPLRMSGECGGRAGGCASTASDTAFLTMPTSCLADQLPLAIGTDSWEHEMPRPLSAASTIQLAGMTGCEQLTLGEPSVSLEADTRQAGSPTGYHVHAQLPQNEEPGQRATPTIRDIEVTMPAGTTISPAAANGLLACSNQQFGLGRETPGECPQASKIGTVKIVSPLVEEPLSGNVYIGQPECGPGAGCTPQQAQQGRMVRLLIEARLPEPPPLATRPAVLIKLAGRTQIDQQTGQLTTVFNEDPQLPFSELELSLQGGPDAPLVNPSGCGPITASARLTAWSGQIAEVLSQPLAIDGCAAPGFTPSFQAGMAGSGRGGAFSSLVVTLSRPDGQQSLGRVAVHMPAGVSAMLSGVPLCPEAQANAGTCSPASLIGTTTTVVGPGSQPYTIEGGKVYLTEKYGGGSFGLSIVTPATAGPFTLAGLNATGGQGNGTVVIRAAIYVNPKTAAITISTGALPTELDGIPLSIDKVIVNVDRPNFMFNPTDCNATAVTGTVDSSSGAVADVSYPFQANNCAALPFKPSFSALTHAKHTRKNGDYLHVVVRSGPGQANIAKVHVQLPVKLPSVLATLRHSCPEATFKANPANCPQGIVGSAVAHTPVLPVPLSGPVYFVSHGAAKFPEIIAVLQGDGVTVDLAGDTKVKGLVTTSTFNSVPDVPISRFDMVLPTGPKSAITGNGNLCKKPLIMPTVITGQNGAVIRKKTKVLVSGCKPALYVMKHHVKGDKVIVVVQTPSGGKITANGKGLARQTHRLRKAGRARISLPLKRFERRRLARGHALKVTVHLHFHPNGKGHGLKASVKVRIRGAHKGKAARRHGRHRR